MSKTPSKDKASLTGPCTTGTGENYFSLPANPVLRPAGKGGDLTPVLCLIYQDDAQ